MRLFVAFAVNRLLSRPGTVFQPRKTVLGKASPPVADDARLTPTSSAIERVLRPSAANNTIRAA